MPPAGPRRAASPTGRALPCTRQGAKPPGPPCSLRSDACFGERLARNAFCRAGGRFRVEKTDRTACFFTIRSTPFFLPEIAGLVLEEGMTSKEHPLRHRPITPQNPFPAYRPRSPAALATVPKGSRRAALRGPWTSGAIPSGHHPAELIPFSPPNTPPSRARTFAAGDTKSLGGSREPFSKGSLAGSGAAPRPSEASSISALPRLFPLLDFGISPRSLWNKSGRAL